MIEEQARGADWQRATGEETVSEWYYFTIFAEAIPRPTPATTFGSGLRLASAKTNSGPHPVSLPKGNK